LYYNLYSVNGTDANSSAYADLSLIIYLKGGPGDSSIITAITEIGQYIAQLNLTTQLPYFVPNPNAWTQNYHVLFIDNPPDTGFSVPTNNDYVQSADQDGDYLMTFLVRFFELYPNTITLPLYITERSYGGKWALTLAYKIAHTSKARGSSWHVILADALIDLVNQYYWAEYAYAAGIIDQITKDSISAFEMEQQEQLAGGNLNAGFQLVSTATHAFKTWVINY